MIRTETADRLRSDIDSGRTGDKVRAPDPAAAPLGADEEAAGTPLSPEVVAATRRAENARQAHAPDRPGLGYTWVLVAAAVVIALILLAAILRRGL